MKGVSLLRNECRQPSLPEPFFCVFLISDTRHAYVAYCSLTLTTSRPFIILLVVRYLPLLLFSLLGVFPHLIDDRPSVRPCPRFLGLFLVE